jgi:hypothetical protein
VSPGNADVESGSTTGSNFSIDRFNDAGAFLSTPFIINRQTGQVQVNTLNASGAATFGTTVTATGKITAVSDLDVGGTALRSTAPGLFGAAGVNFSTIGAVFHIGYTGLAAQYGQTFRPASDNSVAIAFVNAANTVAGTISQSTASVAYNTSSDGRLKEDLQSFDAGNIIDDTEVYDFAWKSTGERAFGVIAQQAKAIYPTAITYLEEQDWYGVDYSKYVPVLLQELKALRARVATLEGRTDAKPS